ncbi:MAG: hypothetical protein AB8H79_23930, partial [Myxococcota bacterium]
MRWCLPFSVSIVLPVLALGAAGCSRSELDGIALVSLDFGGPDKHAVELDGYGRVTGADWAVGERFLASNPYLASTTPVEYVEGGAPLAFSDGAMASLTAVLTIEQSIEEAIDEDLTLTASGTLGDGTTLQWSGVVSGEAGEKTVELSSSALPGGPYCGVLNIEWTLDTQRGRTLFSDATTHELHISRAAPVKNASMHHTALNLACAAVGTTTTDEAIDAIWSEFATREVRRARDDAPLYYYESIDTSAWAQGMLITQHGECHSWVQLMGHTLGFHGIQAEQMSFRAQPPSIIMQMGSWEALRGTEFVG